MIPGSTRIPVQAMLAKILLFVLCSSRCVISVHSQLTCLGVSTTTTTTVGGCNESGGLLIPQIIVPVMTVVATLFGFWMGYLWFASSLPVQELERYQQEGVEVQGMVLRNDIELRRVGGPGAEYNATRNEYRIVVDYRMPTSRINDEENDDDPQEELPALRKSFEVEQSVYEHALESQEISLVVLPGHPLSGRPLASIQDRLGRPKNKNHVGFRSTVLCLGPVAGFILTCTTAAWIMLPFFFQLRLLPFCFPDGVSTSTRI
jgi:hypothetical protein